MQVMYIKCMVFRKVVVMAREVKRININVPVETLERIDTYADNMSINRTSAILVLLSQAMDSQKAMSDLGEFLKLYQEEQKKTDKAE